MSDQNPSGLAAPQAASTDEPKAQTDQGVPVGAADADADRARAAGESQEADSTEDYLDQVKAEGSTDQGVPVGADDAEQDRLNAGEDA